MPSSRSNRGKATGSRYGGSAKGSPGKSVSYGDIAPEVLHRAVVAVTSAGDAITFGRTSEGGAYYVGVLSDGQLEKWYEDGVDSVQDALVDIALAGEALIV